MKIGYLYRTAFAFMMLLSLYPGAAFSAQPVMEIREIFSDSQSLQWLLDIEAALARAEARLGVIPRKAAEEITHKAQGKLISPKALAEETKKVDHPLVALINVWAREMEGDAGEYIHFGATTSDIYDTMYILQLRAAARAMLKDMREIEDSLIDMARKHRSTPMIGRTLGQHALPITFGLKVGSWAAENRRNMERLKDWLRRTNTGILSGAVGTYAGLGDKGLEIEALTMKELGLDPPDAVDWHGSRDKFADFGNVMALIGITFQKIGQEIFLLQSTDLGEVEEYAIMAVGSSTMPHKRNPNQSRNLVIQSRKIRRNAEVLLDWMVSIHERDQISSAGELKEICLNTDRLLKAAKPLLKNLVVKPDAMLQNLGKTKGLIMAEEMMFVLGKKIGKHTAHEEVRKVTQEAFQKGITFKEALLSHPEIAKNLNPEELDTLLDPTRYIGLSPQAVDRLIEETQKFRATDPS